MCDNKKFAPYSTFCRLDRDARECLVARDIMFFLDSNGVKAEVGDCAKVVRFFDSDEDGILSYSDFIQMVLPCDNNEMRAEVQRRPYSRIGRFDSLDVEIEQALSLLLRHEIDLIKRVEGLVRDLQCSPDFTTHAAYRAVDRYEEGKITKENLTDFFRQFGNYLSEAEVFAIIRRMDTDGDAKVSYEEFADYLVNQVN